MSKRCAVGARQCRVYALDRRQGQEAEQPVGVVRRHVGAMRLTAASSSRRSAFEKKMSFIVGLGRGLQRLIV